MTLVLQLKQQLADALAAQAKAQGVSAEEYAQRLLEQQLTSEVDRVTLTLEEFEAALDQLASHSEKIPDLPLEALTREAIYRDHD